MGKEGVFIWGTKIFVLPILVVDMPVVVVDVDVDPDDNGTH